MNTLAYLGDVLDRRARSTPNAICCSDLEREMTAATWFDRACRLANALLGIGLQPGDRFAILAYNRLEWMEIYAAAALSGLVAVPVNFRLTGGEVRFILEDCDARALIVENALAGTAEDALDGSAIPASARILLGAARPVPGFRDYEDLILSAGRTRPAVRVAGKDPWALMYTSGTTGNPKGAIRSHSASTLLSLTTATELSIRPDDNALLVMPLCHANSFFFLNAFAHVGAKCTIYSRPSFDPGEMLRTLAERRATFTSLVPTHYTMMLAEPEAARRSYRYDALSRLMISSAPARRETKLAVMDQFPAAGLFELYGSSETGFVTMLHPEDQLTKLGSVGRECVGTLPVRLLDDDGNDVADGQPGELFSCNAYTFDGYWGLPEKTRSAFRGDYCSVGDVARRDEDGYFYLVDRRSNMIISGGENIYPSEVEAVLAAHPLVRDVAVIGLDDPVWGERVHAVVVRHDGAVGHEQDLLDWCRDRIAGHKRPKSLSFITEDAMPRTSTGKIQHAILKRRIADANRTTVTAAE
ncbi:AMP-binding protein [Rhodobacterales bacterium HKCCE3408]|nr:AMP-binding protein [Rhodobacterales bacterium HKCCE3408]